MGGSIGGVVGEPMKQAPGGYQVDTSISGSHKGNDGVL